MSLGHGFFVSEFYQLQVCVRMEGEQRQPTTSSRVIITMIPRGRSHYCPILGTMNLRLEKLPNLAMAKW